MTMRLDGKRWVSMPMAVLIWLISATVSAALAWGAMQSDQKITRTTLDDHSARILRVETRLEDLREMKNDISWIKATMQEDRRRLGR